MPLRRTWPKQRLMPREQRFRLRPALRWGMQAVVQVLSSLRAAKLRPKQATAIAHPLATAFEKMRVQRLEALEHRDRHQEVPSRIPAEPLDLALVVALARAAEAVLEQVVRLQFGEDACPLALAVA